MKTVSNLHFPASFPESLKGLALEEFDLFKTLALLNSNPENVRRYQRFISDPNMSEFWQVVEARLRTH